MNVNFLNAKKLAAILLGLSMLFALTGCKDKPVPKNEAGWHVDFASALEEAKSSNKKIMILFSRDDKDVSIQELKKNIFDTPEFAETYGPDYVFCNMDYSVERFKHTKTDGREITKAEIKQNDRDMRTAVIYGMTSTPSMLLLSPEGYVISSLSYLPGSLTLKDFSDLIAYEKGKIDDMENNLSALHGTKDAAEKIQIIDRIYETTDTNYRYALNDLIYSVPKLDPSNKTGLVGKYVLAAASSKSVDCYLARQPGKTAEVYTKTAKSKYLDVTQKQQCYFAAAYVSRTNDPSIENSEKIIGYLNEAVKLDPESPIGQRAAEMIAMENDRVKRYNETEAKKKAEGAEE